MYKKEIPDQVGNDSSEDDKLGMTYCISSSWATAKDPVNSCNAIAEINWMFRGYSPLNMTYSTSSLWHYLLPLMMAARSAPLKFVFSLKAATIAVSDFWQAIIRL